MLFACRLLFEELMPDDEEGQRERRPEVDNEVHRQAVAIRNLERQVL